MKPCFILGNVLMLCCLSACNTSPVAIAETARPAEIAEEAPKPIQQTAPAAPVTEHADETAKPDNGLGTVAYNEQRRKECKKRIRTGTRIRRDVCNATGFNGMYPSGGINVGTATEGQRGYGPR